MSVLLRLLTFGLLVVLLVEGQMALGQVAHDGRPFILVSSINIDSPINATYTIQPLILNVTVRSYLNPNASVTKFLYSIDGKTNTTLPTQAIPVPLYYTDDSGKAQVSIFSYYLIVGNVTLPIIQNGIHRLDVYASYVNLGSDNSFGQDNKTIHFTINDGVSATVSIISPVNRTYGTRDIPVIFYTDQPLSWVGYSLDKGTNVIICGNSTIASLPNGQHTITFYTKDTLGNSVASQTVHFVVASFLPNLVYVGIIVTLIALGACLVILVKVRINRTPII